MGSGCRRGVLRTPSVVLRVGARWADEVARRATGFELGSVRVGSWTTWPAPGRRRHQPVTPRRQTSPVQIGRVILYFLGPRPHRYGLFLWGRPVGAAICEGTPGVAGGERWASGFGRSRCRSSRGGAAGAAGITQAATPCTGPPRQSVASTQQWAGGLRPLPKGRSVPLDFALLAIR